jgi:SulP family sulfate permease
MRNVPPGIHIISGKGGSLGRVAGLDVTFIADERGWAAGAPSPVAQSTGVSHLAMYLWGFLRMRRAIMDSDASENSSRSTTPLLGWLRSYQVAWLRPDAVAGISLAAFAIPVSMAYASLAGLPPEFGIYCYLVGGLCYALVGSARQLAVGPTSAISLLVGFSLAEMIHGDAPRYLALAAVIALTVGIISILAWLFRLSSLVDFISDTVLLGFKAGAGLTIAVTQLPKLFGVPGGGEFFFERVWLLITQLPKTNLATLVFGLVALALLFGGERLFPRRPIALIVVVLSIMAVAMTPLAHAGLKTVGELPGGLPSLDLPVVSLADVYAVLPIAFACFLLAFIESVSTARTLAAEHGYEIDARQELLGLGVANLGVSLAHGYPVAGGLSQSMVNDKAGARSPLSLVFASLAIALCLLYLTSTLRNLPMVVLAAIVLFAVSGLLKPAELRRLYTISRTEFWIAIAALVGVLVLGILQGVLLAAVLSLVLLIAQAARPRVVLLGRIPGTRRYSDLERHPDNEAIAGALIFRPEGAIVYFNADHVRQRVLERLRSATDVRLVVCDLSSVPSVDVAGARMLGDLQHECVARGAAFRVAEPHARVRDLLRAAGLEDALGGVSRRVSVDDLVADV